MFQIILKFKYFYGSNKVYAEDTELHKWRVS